MRDTETLTRSQRAHVKRIVNDAEISEGMIHALASMANRGTMPREIADALSDRSDSKNPLRVTQAQADKGLGWANALRFSRKTRKPRAGNPFNAKQDAVLDSLTHYTFEGFEEITRPNTWRSIYVPIYRAHGSNGDSFAYCSASWMTGDSKLSLMVPDSHGYYVPQAAPARIDLSKVQLPFPIPYTGPNDFRLWKRTKQEWFCDSSGFGAPDEPALMPGSFAYELRRHIIENPSHRYGITQTGQFQVYVTAFEPAPI